MWGLLTACHSVIQVVDADYGHVHVPAGRVDKMIAADGEEIAVSGNNHDFCLRSGPASAGGKGNGPSMCGVKRIQPDITCHASGTADAGNHGNGIWDPACVLNLPISRR